MGFFSNISNNKRKAAIREFIFDTVRKLDAIVTRSKFEKFINLPDGRRIIYAYLYGIAVYTWSVRKTNMKYEHFAEIFNIVDTALDEVGIQIPHHLDLDRDFDKVNTVFNDIYANSIGGGSLAKEELLASTDPDFQIIGSHYAAAFSRNDMELAKVYIVKVINTIEEALDNGATSSTPTDVPEEKDESLKVLEYTAGIGVSESQFLLAQAHYTGSFGLDIDFNEALYWAEKSAEQGYAKGQLFSALRYLSAEGTERDEYSAKYWLKKAIDNKDNFVKNEAQKILDQVVQFENLDPEFLK